MSCKYNNCKHCGYKSECEIYKENAELKELLDCENCCELEESECGSCVEFGHFRCKGKEQLTKAKEIIKTFLGFAETFGYSPSMDKFITEAEQFLKEE